MPAASERSRVGDVVISFLGLGWSSGSAAASGLSVFRRR